MRNLKKLTMIHQPHLLACAVVSMFVAVSVSAQTLVQTFEAGEDTSNWGADWVGPSGFDIAAPGFLDMSLGGSLAASASSQHGQEAFRDFRNNTAGLDVRTSAYTISYYVKFNFAGGGNPASGNLYMIDGDFGESAAKLRLEYNGGSPSTLAAYDNGNWQPMDLPLDGASPYLVQLSIDPVTHTYSTSVAQVDLFGTVLSSATLFNLGGDQDAFNNDVNGQVFFHIEGSAGHVDFGLDNINVQQVPEPASAAVFVLGAAALSIAVKRRHPRSSSNSPPAR